MQFAGLDLDVDCLVVVSWLPIGPASAQDTNFAKLARSAGTPQIPGLNIVYFSPLGDPALAPWRNIILHQTEQPAAPAAALARQQAANPRQRGFPHWFATPCTSY